MEKLRTEKNKKGEIITFQKGLGSKWFLKTFSDVRKKYGIIKANKWEKILNRLKKKKFDGEISEFEAIKMAKNKKIPDDVVSGFWQ